MRGVDREPLGFYFGGLAALGMVSGIEFMGKIDLGEFYHLGPIVLAAVGALVILIPAHRQGRFPQVCLYLAFVGLLAVGATYGIIWYFATHPIQPPDFAAISLRPTQTPLRQ
jgi:hypothetical protein